MSTLLKALPQPTQLVLAGKTYTASQLLVRDLAAVQYFVETHNPHPLDAIREELPKLDDAGRRKALREAYQAAKTWPPVMGGPEATAAMSTVVGLAYLLVLVLSKHQPFSAADGLELAEGITGEELASLYRVAYGHDVQEELIRLILGDEEGEGEVEAPHRDDWGEIIDEVARSHGWTYDEVGGLTISQLCNAINKGRRPDRWSTPRPGQSIQQLAAERRKRFYGDDPVAPGPAPAPEIPATNRKRKRR